MSIHKFRRRKNSSVFAKKHTPTKEENSQIGPAITFQYLDPKSTNFKLGLKEFRYSDSKFPKTDLKTQS
jgi:hypothetical protein